MVLDSYICINDNFTLSDKITISNWRDNKLKF